VRKNLFLFLILGIASFADSFITKEEYAKMLYENPRGIGCNKCHGEDGRGREIGRYIQKGKLIKVVAPNITNLSFERFYKALTSNRHKLMPRYFLTKKEIEILYYYLKEKR
jgi:hypothetical protein